MTWEDDPSEEPRENLKPVPPTDDEVRQVYLGTEGDPRPILLSASLSSEEAEQYVQLLKLRKTLTYLPGVTLRCLG